MSRAGFTPWNSIDKLENARKRGVGVSQDLGKTSEKILKELGPGCKDKDGKRDNL